MKREKNVVGKIKIEAIKTFSEKKNQGKSKIFCI